MNMQLLRTCGVLTCGLVQLLAQPEPTAHTAVRNVIPEIAVSLEVQTADKEIVIPYCGETEYGTPVLCIIRTKLEVETKSGWSPAKLRTTHGVLGGEPTARIKREVISPRMKGSFVFVFSRRYFDVEVGDRLRVVIDAWPDEESMKTGQRPMQVISPPFECPQAGTGS